jgi:hypothetical protein
VEFENERDAGAALKGMDGREFSGQRMRVEFAKPREPGSGRPRGGMGGHDSRGPPPAGGRDSFDDRRRDDPPRDDRRRDDRDPRDERRRDARDVDPRDPRAAYGAMAANPYAAYYAAAAYGGQGGYPGMPPYGMPGGIPPYGMPPYGGAFPDPRGPPPPERYRDQRGRSPPRGRGDDYSQQRRGVGPPQGREHICFSQWPIMRGSGLIRLLSAVSCSSKFASASASACPLPLSLPDCNLTGHWAKDCPKPKNSGECYTCGERGHAQRDCPKGRPQHPGGPPPGGFAGGQSAPAQRPRR